MRRPLRLPCFDRCSLCPNASQRTLWRLSHSPSLSLAISSLLFLTLPSLSWFVHTIFVTRCIQTSSPYVATCDASTKHVTSHEFGCVLLLPAAPGPHVDEPNDCMWQVILVHRTCWMPWRQGFGSWMTEGAHDARVISLVLHTWWIRLEVMFWCRCYKGAVDVRLLQFALFSVQQIQMVLLISVEYLI